jgi:hypothetical protein
MKAITGAMDVRNHRATSLSRCGRMLGLVAMAFAVTAATALAQPAMRPTPINV